jgi:CheY-like chemotaxis protein
VNLLSRTSLDSEQRDYVETLKISMGDLLAIVNDILDFSRIESNKLSIHNVEFDLLEAISDVVSLFSVSATAKGLQLNMALDGAVPLTVECDPVRLRQVLSNLISNAVKFTEQGEINLRVSVDSSQGDDFILRFEVEDSGVGIDAADAALLFEAFTQMHADMGGGTGLGLAISRRLLELMGGDISVKPCRCGGSIFSFTLPVKRLQQDARAYPLHESPELENFSGKRVLVVDDNAINRKLITTLLGKMGVATVEAEDGHAALACHQGDCFDLILMDIRMPGMDGVEATRRIRMSEDRQQRIPIIALTAHALPHERETFILAGMDDCLAKPIREDELVALLLGNLCRD